MARTAIIWRMPVLFAIRHVLAPAVLMSALIGCQSYENIRRVPQTTERRADAPITVMTYNIRVGYGSSNSGVDPYVLRNHKKSLAPIIKSIGSADPDIVGLQEVAGPGQAKLIAKALDLNYAFVWHETGSRRAPWWGVALLSKFPIEHARQIPVSFGSGNTKSAVVADIRIGTRLVSVFSIHKDKDLHDGASFRRLGNVVREIPHPVILTGDFNATPDDPRFNALGRSMIDTGALPDTKSAMQARDRGTWAEVYGWRIDLVLVDSEYFGVVDAGIVESEHWPASDHIAYYAIIAFN